MAGEVRELTDADFPSFVEKGASVVDFYGTWCPPCKLLEPVIERLAGDYAGRAAVGRLNVDEHSEAAVDNSVENIPTVVMFRDGREEARLYGAQSFETLAAELERVLAR